MRLEGEDRIENALSSRLLTWATGAQCSWGPSENMWNMFQNMVEVCFSQYPGTSGLDYMSTYHPKATGIWTGYLQHLFYRLDVITNLYPQNSIQNLMLQMTTK